VSDSNVILLSVDISAVLSLVSKNCKFSSAFSIASCSAFLFEHRLFNLYFFVSMCVCVGVCMYYGCVYICGFLCGCMYMWVCVCVGVFMCGCVYVWVFW